jgi:hypothetical protein
MRGDAARLTICLVLLLVMLRWNYRPATLSGVLSDGERVVRTFDVSQTGDVEAKVLSVSQPGVRVGLGMSTSPRTCRIIEQRDVVSHGAVLEARLIAGTGCLEISSDESPDDVEYVIQITRP